MITILSYCDTNEKKNQLSNLITSLKIKFPEKKILVYSHYQDLEPKYYKGTDYYIFDITNPISTKSFTDWIYVYHQYKKFHRSGIDCGFAVMQMIKRACLFLLSFDVKENLIINYDCSVDDIDNISSIQIEEGKIGSFSFWGSGNENNPNPAINLTFMYLKISEIGKEFFESITYEKYMSYDTSIIPESVFGRIINESFRDRWVVNKLSMRSVISLADRQQIPNNHGLKSYFSTVLPTRNNLPSNNHKCLAIWTCSEKVNNIVVSINNTDYTLYNEIEGEYSEKSFFSHLPEDINIEEITLLSVNSKEIEPYSIDGLDDIYWKSNYHDPCFD